MMTGQTPGSRLLFHMRAEMEQLIYLLVVRCFDVSYRDLFINPAIPPHGVPLQD